MSTWTSFFVIVELGRPPRYRPAATAYRTPISRGLATALIDEASTSSRPRVK